MKKVKSCKWDVAKGMPPKRHTLPGEDFDIRKSEAALWLVQQPEIMQLVFNAAKDKRLIVYDPATGQWSGVDYDN